MVRACAVNHYGLPGATYTSGPSELRTAGVATVMALWPLHGWCVDLLEAVKHETTVYFSMIKDVLHIMFTLVRKRKDSSF